MTDTPLVPFVSPFTVLAHFGIGSGAVVEILLLLIFALWLIYTFVAIYHWLKYSHASLVALPAIFVHLFVSAAIVSWALTGNWIP